ncbi:hypothetical protein BaRGS_00016222 [Batillaria attramentaria]|uniref:Uncharacterized protein n=1 Tax=Batillaria attramentaria TaxID=370345 RepID=A0ABD0KZM3_9CAEN
MKAAAPTPTPNTPSLCRHMMPLTLIPEHKAVQAKTTTTTRELSQEPSITVESWTRSSGGSVKEEEEPRGGVKSTLNLDTETPAVYGKAEKKAQCKRQRYAIAAAAPLSPADPVTTDPE